MLRLSYVCLLLLLGVTGVSASETIANWQAGPGWVAGAPSAAGQSIAWNERIASGSQSAAIVVPELGATRILLAPDSALHLRRIDQDLVVVLERGRIECRVDTLGDFEQFRVHGAALDVRVTGTIFVVERQAEDRDWVVVIEGSVKVGLLAQVAKALRKTEDDIDLEPRQSLSGSTQSGLADVVPVDVLPDVPEPKAPADEPPGEMAPMGGMMEEAQEEAIEEAVVESVIESAIDEEVLIDEIIELTVTELAEFPTPPN